MARAKTVQEQQQPASGGVLTAIGKMASAMLGGGESQPPPEVPKKKARAAPASKKVAKDAPAPQPQPPPVEEEEEEVVDEENGGDDAAPAHDFGAAAFRESARRRRDRDRRRREMCKLQTSRASTMRSTAIGSVMRALLTDIALEQQNNATMEGLLRKPSPSDGDDSTAKRQRVMLPVSIGVQARETLPYIVEARTERALSLAQQMNWYMRTASVRSDVYDAHRAHKTTPAHRQTCRAADYDFARKVLGEASFFAYDEKHEEGFVQPIVSLVYRGAQSDILFNSGDAAVQSA